MAIDLTGRRLQDLARYGSLLLLILIISLFHYGTATESRYLHEIYQRVYYIPILLAAYWYGPVLGIVSALLTSSIYAYHIHHDWAQFPVYSFNQYAEIVLYHVIALTIGVIASKDRKHRRALEQTSRELAAAHEELQRSFEHLKRADRLASLGQLSASIAHEIRNPLGSIKGAAEILEDRLLDEDVKQEFIGVIKEETTRLNAIVNSFLEFARPRRPLVEPSSVNDLIDSTLALLENQAERSRVRISRKLKDSLPLINLDPDQIRQVLLNVMLNGIEAMPEGGVLEVRSEIDRRQGAVVIEISDTGEGLEDAELDHVFDPFFTTKPQGTGLGLSISFQVMENHGGKILARRNLDRGLTLRIELPLGGIPAPRALPVKAVAH